MNEENLMGHCIVQAKNTANEDKKYSAVFRAKF